MQMLSKFTESTPMKLHLPLRLLFALLTALSASATWAATVTASSTQVTLDPKEYADGLQVEVTDEGRLTMNSASTKVAGVSGIEVRNSSLFVLENGTLGNGAGSSVSLAVKNGSSFIMGGSGVSPVFATGRGASAEITLTGSSFIMRSGLLATSGASLTLNVGSGSVVDINNGTISNGFTLYTPAEGGSATVHSTAVIQVNDGGQFNLGSSGYIGYAGGGAMVHVNHGGVFTQSGGAVSFARGSEGGRVEMQVHEGGTYSLKGGGIATSNGAARITVEQGGLFELGASWRTDSSGKTTKTQGTIVGSASSPGAYADIIVQSGAVFNMTDGSIATASGTTGKPAVQLLVSGAFNQSGGEITTGIARTLVVVQGGGNYTQSGGVLGSESGAAAVVVQRGGNFTLRGSGSLSGNVELALGYTPDFSVSNAGATGVWGDAVTPETPAEKGSATLVQEGGVISGAVQIGLVGEGVSYTLSGGDLTGQARVSLSGGAGMSLSGEGEISGSVGVNVGSGCGFNMSGGTVGESASLTFEDVQVSQSGGTITGNAGVSLSGGSYTFSGGSISSSGSIVLSNGAVFAQSGNASMMGSSISVTGKGSSFSLSGEAAVSGTSVSLGEGTSFTMSGGSLGGSLSAAGATLMQSGGLISADVGLSNGTAFTQQTGGAVLGNVGVAGSTFTQAGGSIVHGSVVSVTSGGSFTQQSGSVDAAVSVSDGRFEQSGMVSGEVVVSGKNASYTQAGGNITEGTSVSVESGASLTQSAGVMDAEVRVSNGAGLTQTGGSIIGSVEVSGNSALVQQGSIEGQVQLSSGAILQASGSITGNVSATGASVEQSAGSITGDVTLGKGASLTQTSGSIVGALVAEGAELNQQTGGSITGDVSLGSGASFTQSGGSIGGLLTVGSGSVFTRKSGELAGGVSVDGGRADLGEGAVGGAVQVSGKGIYSQGDGDIGGSVQVTDSTFEHGRGSIGGGIAASGAGLTHAGGDIAGDIELSRSTLTHAAGGESNCILGGVSLKLSSALTLGGIVEVAGAVSADGASSYTQNGGSIGSGLSLSGGSSAVLEGVAISGGVSVVGGSSARQVEGSIVGDVSVDAATFTQGGAIDGQVSVTNGATFTINGAGSITGNVKVDAAGFSQSGTVRGGSVSLSNNARYTLESGELAAELSLSDTSSFEQKGGAVSGKLALASGSAYTLASGSVSGDISVGGGASFSQSGGSVSSAAIALEGGSIALSGGEMEATVTMSGESARFDMGGLATAGSIALHGGSLQNAAAFSGELYVDTEASYAQAIELGGVAADRLRGVATRNTGAVIRGLSGGVLTFEGVGNTMLVGTETSNARAEAAYSLINFEDTSGRIAFADGGSITLNFSANVLIEAKKNLGNIIEVWFTNGELVDAPSDSAELAAWLTSHFVVGSGLLGDDDSEAGWTGADNGRITLHVSSEGIWISSMDGSVTNDAEWGAFMKHKLLIVDEDMSINQAGQSSMTLHQLSSGGDHTGNLSIQITAAGAEVTLLNHESVAGSGNGDTVFNGNLSIEGAHAGSSVLRKEGEGSLTLSGNLTSSGALQVATGVLVLSGQGSRVGALSVENDASLMLSGSLTLTGGESRVDGSLFGGGELVLDRGSLELNGDVEVSLSLGERAEVRSFGSVSGQVSLTGADSVFTFGDTRRIEGAVEISGERARLEASGSSIGESVVLSGEGSVLTGGGAVGGSVILSGKSASFEGGDVAGEVELSGSEASFSGGAIGGNVVLNGAGAKAVAGAVQGGVLLAGEQSRFAQFGAVQGEVVLSGRAARLVGDDSGMGGLSLTAAGAEAIQVGDIVGDVWVSGEGASVSGVGAVGGGVSLSAAGGSYSGIGAIAGSVEISGERSSLYTGAVGGNVLQTGNASTAEVAGPVAGSVSVSGEGAFFIQSGVVAGGVELSGAGSTYRQIAGVEGDVMVSGEKAGYEQTGTVAGSITVSGEGANYIQTGLVRGDVSIAAAGVYYGVADGGSITGSVLLNGAGAVLNLETAGSVDGAITLQAGVLLNAGAYGGAGVYISTSEAQHGALELGDLRAEKIMGVTAGQGVVLTGLAAGSRLSFSGVNSMFVGAASASYGSNAATGAMICFSGSGGSVGFAEGGQLKLRFEDEVRRGFGSGELAVWLTDGSLAGAPTEKEALLSWLREHILLATGNGLDFALESGDFSGAQDGWLTIAASSSDIWRTTEESALVTDPAVFDSYSKVEIDADTTIQVSASEDSRATLRQVEGTGNLSLSNEGSGIFTVEFNNQNVLGYYGETVFNGDITAEGQVAIEKTGDADLTLMGNLHTPGKVSVKEGRLVLAGELSSLGAISLGQGSTEGELVVGGHVQLTGESDLSQDRGSITGSGDLELVGSLTLGSAVSLNGPNVRIDAAGALHLRGQAAHYVASLSGSGILDFGEGGALAVGGGSFSGALLGSGQLVAQGKGTVLELIGSGGAGVDLVVGANAAVTLVAGEMLQRISGQSIAWRSIVNSGTLVVGSSAGQSSLVAAGDITLAVGSVTQVSVDLSAPAADPALESTSGHVVLASGSSIQLSIAGKPEGDQVSITLIRSALGVCNEYGEILADGTQLSNVSFDDSIFELIYDAPSVVVSDDGRTVLLTAALHAENPLEFVAASRNSRAGSDLLLEAVQVADPDTDKVLIAAGNAVADMIAAGQRRAAANTLAAIAGSSVPALGTAQRDALREQVARMRDLASAADCMRYIPDGESRAVHASIQAVGSYARLNATGDESGYKMTSWGGMVSADVAVNRSWRLGLALTALYGDLEAEAPDTASGNLDSYYANLFLRGHMGRWSHTFVASFGLNSAELDRSVHYGSGSYSTHGSTDGFGFGALYELGCDIALDEQKSSILQPLFNVSLLSSSMSGYDETGASGAGLRVGEQSWTTVSFGLGVRWLAVVDADVFGKAALAELRANVSQDFGDTTGSADVALLANPGFTRTVHGSEVGSTALQLGAGLSIPLTKHATLHFNAGGEVRSGSTGWSGAAGVRIGF